MNISRDLQTRSPECSRAAFTIEHAFEQVGRSDALIFLDDIREKKLLLGAPAGVSAVVDFYHSPQGKDQI